MFNVRLVSEDQLSALEKAANAIMTSEDAASAGSKLRIRRVISQLEAQLGVSEPVDEGGAEWFGLIDVDQQAIQAVEDSLASKLEDVALASKLVAQADAFFAAIDVDGNGEISFGELEAHLEDLGFNRARSTTSSTCSTSTKTARSRSSSCGRASSSMTTQPCASPSASAPPRQTTSSTPSTSTATARSRWPSSRRISR